MIEFEYVNASEPDRIDWPFKSMEVGQTVRFLDGNTRAQQYAHTYAQASGRKFKTWKREGFIYVQRVA